VLSGMPPFVHGSEQANPKQGEKDEPHRAFFAFFLFPRSCTSISSFVTLVGLLTPTSCQNLTLLRSMGPNALRQLLWACAGGNL
jgi:hypothetical protein